MAEPGRIRLIVNESAGQGAGGEMLEALRHHLTMRTYTVDVGYVRGPRDGRDLAASVPSDTRCVVSIGGDGTHREVASGLAGSEVPFCIVSYGTENVLAKTFGVRGTLKETLFTIQRGRPVRLDVPELNGRPFVMFSGVGFDAAVTRKVHADRDGPIRRASYYGPIARLFFSYKFPRLTVRVDDEVLCDDAGLVFLGNTPEYADRMHICGRAVADDGLLDVCCFRMHSRWKLGPHMLRVKLGRHVDHDRVAYGQGRRITVTSDGAPEPVQADGDALAETPATYTIRPKALTLLVPPGDLLDDQ